MPGEVRQEGHDGNLVVPAVQDVPHLDKHGAAPNPPVRGSTVDRGTQNTRQLQGSPRSLKVAVEVARFRNTGVVSGSVMVDLVSKKTVHRDFKQGSQTVTDNQNLKLHFRNLEALRHTYRHNV